MMDLFENIENCNMCELCHNQPPLVQKSTSADVFWVGISAVKTDNLHDTPLSNTTNSGKLIDRIECNVCNTRFHKTNIVKCLPTDDKDKIRYPSMGEMHKCYSHIESEVKELKPNIIVLLGKQVASYMLKKNGVTSFELSSDFHYKTIPANGQIFLPVHHPSYILVYKRKRLTEYISGIANVLNHKDLK